MFRDPDKGINKIIPYGKDKTRIGIYIKIHTKASLLLQDLHRDLDLILFMHLATTGVNKEQKTLCMPHSSRPMPAARKKKLKRKDFYWRRSKDYWWRGGRKGSFFLSHTKIVWCFSSVSGEFVPFFSCWDAWCVKPKFLHIVPSRYLHSNCQTTFSQGWEHVTNNDEIKHDNAWLQKIFFVRGRMQPYCSCYRLGQNGEAMLKWYHQDIFQ